MQSDECEADAGPVRGREAHGKDRACWGEAERATRADVDLEAGTVFLRGTKRQSRERVVPLVTASQRQLVGFALDHGAGAAGRIFRPWSAVRGDLGRACARAGIEPCSPNDLRRTTATWMRQGGVAPDVIGALLGHADGRMVERVYGRMTTGALADIDARRRGHA